MLSTVVHAGFLDSGLVTFFSYVLGSDNQKPTSLCGLHRELHMVMPAV